MSVIIRETKMTGAHTAHYARPSRLPTNPPGGWLVTWLPGRVLTRNQAITAMTIAEIVWRETLSFDNTWWPFLDNWAGELDLTGPEAVKRCAEREVEVRVAACAELADAAAKVREINAKAGA